MPIDYHNGIYTKWLLDVDGVLNVNRSCWGTQLYKRTVSTPDGQEWTIKWSPELIKRVKALAYRDTLVDIVWCTTWCPDAEILEDLWRLPKLCRAFDHAGFVGDAKLAAAREVIASGCRLVWTDDMEVPMTGPLYRELTADGRALLIQPNAKYGLGPEDMDRIEEFINA